MEVLQKFGVPISSKTDSIVSLFERGGDYTCLFVLWGVRDPQKVAQMISSFAEMCGGIRRSGTQFTAKIEVPGDTENIDWILTQVVGNLQGSSVVDFYDGSLNRMFDAKGRLGGKITFQTK